ncbi:oxygenase MpaB family protein [Dactylosporangium salmoneum]|uniref:ER-bound oxygenase mpaB/mpaB'/Rubber oxygenase catalytic domain-containing protein n=1 Tax=Dactylosporangium salmoneum TaxID=53361 RepID=A0ABN3H4K4_9ACTN
MRRFDLRDRVAGLDPVRDHAEIVRLLMFHEFPWDVRMAGRLMIWHLYANPPVAAAVGHTDALLERAEITSLTFGDLVEHGLDSPRGRAILRWVNRSHRGTPVTAEHNAFALAALAVTLTRWLDRFGWRPLTPGERTALAVFYAELGRRMGVRALPRSPDELARELERAEAGFSFTEAGRQCSERTLAMARARVRPWLRPLVRPVVAALLAPGTRAAVGLRPAPRLVRAAVHAALLARRRVVRLLPPRAAPTTPRTRRRLADQTPA